MLRNLLLSLIALNCATIAPNYADLPLMLRCDCEDMHGATERSFTYSPNNWMAYGTFVLAPYTNTDNPNCNLLGLAGEVTLPYRVPDGYNLTIDYLQIEGPAGPQVGMALWLGDAPCSNAKSIISCTTAGGSTQLQGMLITIPEGEIVNIRVMNNTAIPWCNGFYLQGQLHPVGAY